MKNSYENEVYFGTIILEKNRWAANERIPSVKISDWLDDIESAGFDGLELWQNHALYADKDELHCLASSEVPVSVFNSYDRCENDTIAVRERTVELVNLFSSSGMKYNFGKDDSRHSEYCKNVESWRQLLPNDFRFLCECHGGTTVQNPEVAAKTFADLCLPDYEIIIHGFDGGDDKIKNLFNIHGDKITHIHSNLSHKKEMSEEFVLERIRLLKDLGFKGSFTIEFCEGIGFENEDPKVSFQNAVRDLNLLKSLL